jgi:hypothetical protein
VVGYFHIAVEPSSVWYEDSRLYFHFELSVPTDECLRGFPKNALCILIDTYWHHDIV